MSVEHLAKTFLSPAVPIPPAIAETHQQYTERLYAERNAWAAQCQRAEAEVALLMEQLRERTQEADTLAEELRIARVHPAMREIVGELRRINELLEHGEPMAARVRLSHLLRRIDRESQTEAQQ